MSYPDMRYYITFFFKCYKDFEKSTYYNQTKGPGRPKVHSDSSLIVFFAIMMLKNINQFKAQAAFLSEHLDWVQRLKFKSVPSRTTLSRRYKQLTPILEQFVEYLGDLGVLLDTDTPRDVVFEDKSLYKAQGSVWHQKDRKANHIPEGLRNLDTDASWSTSKYRGWVYGYGGHLTTTAIGFPRLASVCTASVSEKAVLDQKTETLLVRNIRFIVADAGWTDFGRIQKLAKDQLFLLTPITGAKDAQKVAYLETIETSPQLQTYQQQRKTAIEPVFSLLSELTGTDKNQKQLPVSSIRNVKSFLMLAVVLLQIAMLVNSTFHRPCREVSRMKTLFR